MSFYLVNLLKNSFRKQIENEAEKGMTIVSVAEHSNYPRTPFPMCFTKEAFLELIGSVGAIPPESGAMGFSPKDKMGFDIVEFDKDANSSGAVFSPNVEWSDKRREFYLMQPDENMRLWDGHIHSHPSHFGFPSAKSGKGLGDLGYVEEVFNMNEWMEWFFIPILTGTGTDEVQIHPWVCRRGNPVEVMIADLKVCSSSDEFPERVFNPEFEKALAENNREEEQLQDDEQQEEKIELTTDPVDRIDDEGSDFGNDEMIKEYTKRIEGVVSPAFRNKTIAFVGVGAGSYMVEKLARLCPKKIKLCDFDIVEVSNLTRTAYTMSDAENQQKKVDAMAERIQAVNPFVEVEIFDQDITQMDKNDLDNLFEGTDLLVAGTDSFEAQALMNEEAFQRNIPVIFIGIHDGAQGGRIVWCIPGLTNCYRCVAQERYEAVENENEEADLQGVAGAIIDCQFVDMIAAKVSVAILERGNDSRMGQFFEKMSPARNEIIVRCDPEYEWGAMLWDAILNDLPKKPKKYAEELKKEAFFSMDSLWLKSQRVTDCPVCSEKTQVKKRKKNKL